MTTANPDANGTKSDTDTPSTAPTSAPEAGKHTYTDENGQHDSASTTTVQDPTNPAETNEVKPGDGNVKTPTAEEATRAPKADLSGAAELAAKTDEEYRDAVSSGRISAQTASALQNAGVTIDELDSAVGDSSATDKVIARIFHSTGGDPSTKLWAAGEVRLLEN